MKQQALLQHVEIAVKFYEKTCHKIPTNIEVQKLLSICGINETLEHIALCRDIIDGIDQTVGVMYE